MNKDFKDLPKSVKKVIRYIYQDANYDQFRSLERHIDRAIKVRLVELDNEKRENAN